MRIYEPTEDQQRLWREFVDSRPPNVKAVAEKLAPWLLYRLRSGHRATLHGIDEHEDGSVTLTMSVTGDFNAVMFDRNVFGIHPDDLEECDLPAAGDPLGAALTQKQVAENMDAMRVLIRPDLWELDEAGNAVRR